MTDKKPTKKGQSRFLGKNKTIHKDKRGIRQKDTKAGLSEKTTTLKQNPEAKPKSSVSHHDKFFKKAFSEPALAKALAKVILYKEELKVCNLKSLKVEEKQAKANKMDLILTMGLKDFPKEQIHILILVEHKSQYSKNFWQQFLEYQTILLIEAKSPFVLIPAVFYHGRSRWKHKISFQQAFLGEFFEKIPNSFKKSMLNWHARFIDTKDIEDEELRKWLENPRSKASWVAKSMDKIWFLRHDFKLLRKLSLGIFRLFKNREELLSFSKYFGSAGVSKKDWEKIEKEAKQKGLLKKGGLMAGFRDVEQEIRMEGIQQGMQQGIQQGIQQGMQQGMQQGWQERNYEVVSNMLKKNTDVDFISEVTGMPVKEIKKLKNKRS